MMFEPAPWYLSSAWLLPALLLGLGVLVITALSWPIGWAARRRYGAKLAFAGHDLKAYRQVRGFSALVVLVLLGWAVAIGVLMSDINLPPSSDERSGGKACVDTFGTRVGRDL